MSTLHHPWRWLCLLVFVLFSGCMFHRLERNLAVKREAASLSGAVRTEQPTDLPIVVFVYAGERGSEQLIDYFVLAGPGPYFFTVPAGTFAIFWPHDGHMPDVALKSPQPVKKAVVKVLVG